MTSTRLILALLALTVGITSPAEVQAVSTDKAKRRNEPVDMVVLHTIGGPQCRDGRVVFSGAPGDAKRWRDFFEQAEVIGIHHVIDRAGHTLPGIAENRVANHARGYNQRSIGIELVNEGDGREPFTAAQMDSLVELLKGIMMRHPTVTAARIVRHSDLDDRHFECQGKRVKLKQDPGAAFDLQGLRQRLGRH